MAICLNILTLVDLHLCFSAASKSTWLDSVRVQGAYWIYYIHYHSYSEPVISIIQTLLAAKVYFYKLHKLCQGQQKICLRNNHDRSRHGLFICYIVTAIIKSITIYSMVKHVKHLHNASICIIISSNRIRALMNSDLLYQHDSFTVNLISNLVIYFVSDLKTETGTNATIFVSMLKFCE